MKVYSEYINYRKLYVDVPGTTSEVAANLEERITEFEEKYQSDVLALAPLPALILLHNNVYNMINIICASIELLSSIYGAIVVFNLVFVCKGKFAAYLSILNLLTWASPTGLFPYITAGLPTFFVMGIAYTIIMKAWILKFFSVPFVNEIPFEEEK